MELVYDENDLIKRNRCELKDENGVLRYWGIYDFAFKYRTRIFDERDEEIAYVQKDISAEENVVGFFDPADRKIGEMAEREGGFSIDGQDVLYSGNKTNGSCSLFVKEEGRIFVKEDDQIRKVLCILFGLSEIDR